MPGGGPVALGARDCLHVAGGGDHALRVDPDLVHLRVVEGVEDSQRLLARGPGRGARRRPARLKKAAAEEDGLPTDHRGNGPVVDLEVHLVRPQIAADPAAHEPAAGLALVEFALGLVVAVAQRGVARELGYELHELSEDKAGHGVRGETRLALGAALRPRRLRRIKFGAPILIEVGVEAVLHGHGRAPVESPVGHGLVAPGLELAEPLNECVPRGRRCRDSDLPPELPVHGDAVQLYAAHRGVPVALVGRGQRQAVPLVVFVRKRQEVAAVGEELREVPGLDYRRQVVAGDPLHVVLLDLAVSGVHEFHLPAGVVALEGPLPRLPVHAEALAAAHVPHHADDLLVLLLVAARPAQGTSHEQKPQATESALHRTVLPFSRVGEHARPSRMPRAPRESSMVARYSGHASVAGQPPLRQVLPQKARG